MRIDKMEVEKITVGQINSNLFYKSIIVQGMIAHIEDIKPKLITGAFKCQQCDEITTIEQDDSGKLIEPYECLNDVCGRKKVSHCFIKIRFGWMNGNLYYGMSNFLTGKL